MAARKVLTRAEAQAQTRDELLDAAEELFLSQGYRASSVTEIANNAGRTAGALYSNFANKEALCLEVLKRRSFVELSSLITALAEAPDDLAARQAAVAQWWATVSTESDLVILTAEYALATLHDPVQRELTASTFLGFVDSARMLLEQYLPDRVAPAETVQDAALALVATGSGLAFGQAVGFIAAEESVALLAATFRKWLEGLGSSMPA